MRDEGARARASVTSSHHQRQATMHVAHEPQAIIAQLRIRDDITSSAFIPIELVVAAAITFFGVVACTYMRRQRAVVEPLGSLVFWPSVLDAIFGGNRRERVLYPHRFHD